MPDYATKAHAARLPKVLAELATLRATHDRLRALHRETHGSRGRCASCGYPAPCDTAKILDGEA